MEFSSAVLPTPAKALMKKRGTSAWLSAKHTFFCSASRLKPLRRLSSSKFMSNIRPWSALTPGSRRWGTRIGKRGAKGCGSPSLLLLATTDAKALRRHS